VEKTYTFTVKFPLSVEDTQALEAGLDIGGYTTAPCRVETDPAATPREGPQSGRITLHEGKYHQIKRMMEARHNQITSLCRVSFGPLTLEDGLSPGMWRYATPAEIQALEACGTGASPIAGAETPDSDADVMPDGQ
jgi:pseudouridine synthase